MGMVAAAVIVGAGIATASLRGVRTSDVSRMFGLSQLRAYISQYGNHYLNAQRKVEVSHPLRGSINRRIELFSHLAEHNDVQRPPRRYDSDVYLQAPDGKAGAMV